MKAINVLICTGLSFIFAPLGFPSDLEISAFVGGEVWDSETAPGHGIISVRGDYVDVFRGGDAVVEFNTDTLRLGLEGVRLRDNVAGGVSLVGEAGISNLLNEYFIDGDNDPRLGIFASYVRGVGWVKFNPASDLFVTVEGAVRGWVFHPTSSTAESFVMPVDTSAIEPSIDVVWWGLSDDAGWQNPHRLFPRISGVAVGLGLRGVFLSEVRDWGPVVDDLSTTARINSPSESMFLANQWILFGRELGRRHRIEISERASYMTGVDDLYRAVIGGMSPYSVNVPGIPWGFYHADNFVSGMVRLASRVELGQDIEVGPVVGAIALNDASRSGVDDYTIQYGYGAYADIRVGAWQYEIRGGLSPSLRSMYVNNDAWSMFFMCGWSSF